MARKLTTEEWIERARKVHGDKYDYSRVEYAGADSKVTIICPEHGLFSKRAVAHIRREQGCPKCGRREAWGGRRSTLAGFLCDAHAVHGDRYDYSLVDYQTKDAKVTIICPKHGEFEQTPRHHTARGHGCNECGNRKISESKFKDTKYFVRKAREVHGDRYDYSQVEYKTVRDPVKIICHEHGEFDQIPNAHFSGKGCQICGNIAKNAARTRTTEQFISEARETHGDKYDYSLADYKGAHSKVTIICPEHGEFRQTPNNHIRGRNCFYCICADHGFKSSEPAILYYVRVDTPDQALYKIGITNRTVEERFAAGDMEMVTVLDIREFPVGADAHRAEQDVLSQYEEDQYDGPPILANGGNKELFTRDILDLDESG